MTTPFPDVIRIEPAGVCNFHCQCCPVGRRGNKRGLLSLDDFKRILGDLLVPRVLVLYHGGEPFLNEKVTDMAKWAKMLGVGRVVLNTNGSKLKSDMDLSAVDDLRVSFHGTSPGEHDAIRRGAEFTWDARRVRALSRAGGRPKQITIYNINDIGRPADYLLDFFAYCPVVFRWDPVKEWPSISSQAEDNLDITYCPDLWETFTILANGDVVMCCEDLTGEAVQGNVFREPPEDIWDRMQAIRDAFEDREHPELCKRCWRMNERR